MQGQRTRPTARLLAVAAGLTVALAGCGESAAEKTFEGSGNDGPAIQQAAAELRGFSEAHTEFVSALTDERVPASRRAVDSMYEYLRAARDKALDIESTDLRQTMQDYIGTMQHLAATGDRIVAYAEDISGPIDPALENELASDFEEASLDAQKADSDLLNRVMEHASPERREALRDSIRSLQDDFEERVGD